ncbi:protein SLOW GREEN 1, chloroplastic-like [Bidens hawaiensis]|uniref:protein SLOW GREEN 1, chloroplastic-like n=1 Tax=Bidens hawaiensis TaxID=980011 RepID=UPI00404A9F29
MCSSINHLPTRFLTLAQSHHPNSLTLNNFKKPTSIIITNKPNNLQITKFISQTTKTLLIGSFIFIAGFSNSNLHSHSLALAKPQPTHQNVLELDEDDEEMMSLKLLEANPKDVVALKSVINAKMKRAKTKEAVEYVEKLITIQPKEVERRLLQALCYQMIGDYTKAKVLFKNILKHNPLSLTALHGLAMVMHKNHEGPAVFEMLNNALEIARQKNKVTDERNIRILIAQMHVVKAELDDALKQFKDLIDENPRDFRPYLCQGIIYSLLDKKEEAEEQFLTHQSLVPEEFPQRGFLEDVVLAAKTEIRQKNKNKNKELKPDFLYRK